MSHEISFVSTEKGEAFFAGTPAWHGLGTNVQDCQTAAEAIKLASLGWDVHSRPIYLKQGDRFSEIDEKVANVRLAPDGQDVYLGVVGRKYRPIQNHEAFSFMDALVGSGEAVFETAGALREGRRVWILARLPADMEVGEGDRVKRYLLLSNSHDGSSLCRVFWTPVRVVCMNTLRAALGSRHERDGLAIRHSGSIQSKLAEAQRVLGAANEHYARLGHAFRALRGFAFASAEVAEYIHRLVPDASPTMGERTQHRVQRTQRELLDAYNVERLTAGDTAWGAYNAATRWADHVAWDHRPSATAQTRFENLVWGAGNDFKQKAFQVAGEMAGVEFSTS